MLVVEGFRVDWGLGMRERCCEILDVVMLHDH